MKEEADQRYIFIKEGITGHKWGPKAPIPGSLPTPQNEGPSTTRRFRIIFTRASAALTTNSDYRRGFKTT